MVRHGPDPQSTNTHRFLTDRLEIDVPKAEDAGHLFGLMSGDQKEICEMLLWDGPEGPEDMEQWVAQCRSATYGDFGYHWVVRDRLGEISGETGRPLGSIGTRPRGVPGRADVGYWLGRPYWGVGIMREALVGLLDYGFDAFDYNKVEADVFTQNTRGRRLVEGVGMKQEGIIRSQQLKRGQWVDVAVYGLMHNEWADKD